MRKPVRLPLETLSEYLFDVPVSTPAAPDSPACIHWSAVFGNDHPVEIEVGSGKGSFLVAASQAHPETNYLGIEVLRGLQLYIATRIAKRDLSNVLVACTDARRFFHERITTASVQAVHVYFPDPWWKKRHQKRRVWTPEFAADCTRILTPGGGLHAATDVGDYYQIIRELLDLQSGLRLVASSERTGLPGADELLTNFERKARQNGGAVYRAEYERCG